MINGSSDTTQRTVFLVAACFHKFLSLVAACLPSLSLCGAMGKRGSAGIPGSPPGRRLRKQLSGEGGDDDAASTPNTRTLRAVARYKQKYGHSPSQTSKDVDERRLAVRLSKVPRHRKQSLNAESKAENVKKTLQEYLAFAEAH